MSPVARPIVQLWQSRAVEPAAAVKPKGNGAKPTTKARKAVQKRKLAKGGKPSNPTVAPPAFSEAHRRAVVREIAQFARAITSPDFHKLVAIYNQAALFGAAVPPVDKSIPHTWIDLEVDDFAQQLGQGAAAAFLAASKMDGNALLAGKVLADVMPVKHEPSPEVTAMADKKMRPIAAEEMDDYRRWAIERSGVG